MAHKSILNNISKIGQYWNSKRNITLGKIIYNQKTSVPNVSGLSENCVKIPAHPVGPGAAKNTGYKNPEYFCYDKNTYFEAEVEMLKYRCPQPSVYKPYVHTK
ncbi:uncharacterized protein LOC130893653 [Diorhabda carinulata]|uniref:uncharacterized protein LOC130893653 n=1 Tax=Diorhabda carinulata TaxID=1163345 RepID=UPI0025A2A41D|nr:uncharacterized protein LOC130893653 [Diorhabda carinulata]